VYRQRERERERERDHEDVSHHKQLCTLNNDACFAACLLCFSGRIPRLLLIQHMLEWLRSLPHHSQRSSAERWSRNTLMVVTARLFYVLDCFTSLIIQSTTHDVVNREINLWKSFDLLLGSNVWPLWTCDHRGAQSKIIIVATRSTL